MMIGVMNDTKNKLANKYIIGPTNKTRYVTILLRVFFIPNAHQYHEKQKA